MIGILVNKSMDYTRIYLNLIEIAKEQQVGKYAETHHIIPKSIGGSDNAENMVKMTLKQHIFAHKLLYLMLRDTFPNLIHAVAQFWRDDNKYRIEYRKKHKMPGWVRRCSTVRAAQNYKIARKRAIVGLNLNDIDK